MTDFAQLVVFCKGASTYGDIFVSSAFVLAKALF